MQPTGIHHLTEIFAKPRQNLGFCTGLLGKRSLWRDRLTQAGGAAPPGNIDLPRWRLPP